MSTKFSGRFCLLISTNFRESLTSTVIFDIENDVAPITGPLNQKAYMNKLVFICSVSIMLARPSLSRAEVIMNIYQNGSDVVASGSGTLDTTDLTFVTSASGDPIIEPYLGVLRVGPTSGSSLLIYSGLSGPSKFGPGNYTYPGSGSGNEFGVSGENGDLYVPGSYTSGANLSGTDTFSGTTLAGLGLTVGTYTYAWGTGVDADSLVVNVIAPASVPEPSSLTLVLFSAAIGLGARFWSHRRASRD